MTSGDDLVTDPFSLEGRVALITGATRGLGAAMVRRFTAAGARVAITHRGSDRNTELSAGLMEEVGSDRLAVMKADAASREEMNDAVEQVNNTFGTVDILILNAAATEKLPWDQITVENWDLMMEVNLRGAFVGSLAVVDGMRAQGYGKIVTVGSVMSTFGDPRSLHYVTSKGGLVSFARSLSRAEGANGIRVNCLIPGAILVERDIEEGAEPERTLARMKEVQALEYLGKPEDLAAAAHFLVSPASDFITGQVLTVDGGWTNY